MDGAAKHGHFHVVKFLYMNRTEGCTTDAMDGTTKNRHMDVVQFLDENRPEGCSCAALSRAVSKNQLQLLKILRRDYRGAEWNALLTRRSDS